VFPAYYFKTERQQSDRKVIMKSQAPTEVEPVFLLNPIPFGERETGGRKATGRASISHRGFLFGGVA
jgi:hypothetical protein